MERGFEQLIVFAAIIIAGLFDLVARWLKSRQQKDAPVDASAYEEDPLLEEGADFEFPADVEQRSEIELPGEEKLERAPPGEEKVERPLSREESVERALSREEQVERAHFGEELVARRVSIAPPPGPARASVITRRPAPPAPGTPRRASRRLLANPLDARRGIIMMTILGPCRGLES